MRGASRPETGDHEAVPLGWLVTRQLHAQLLHERSDFGEFLPLLNAQYHLLQLVVEVVGVQEGFSNDFVLEDARVLLFFHYVVESLQFLELLLTLIRLLEHLGEKALRDAFVFLLDRFQDQEAGNVDEDVAVSVLNLFIERFVLFSGSFDYLGEVEQLLQFLWVQEMLFSKTPYLFKVI